VTERRQRALHCCKRLPAVGAGESDETAHGFYAPRAIDMACEKVMVQ
jgi:hypothetical protein